MKRLLCGAAVAATLLISATPSAAQVVNMTATLGGAEETTATPGLLGTLTGAVGTATVAVDATNEELSVTLALFNFETGTTAGHIHIAPRGVAALTWAMSIARTPGMLAIQFERSRTCQASADRRLAARNRCARSRSCSTTVPAATGKP